LLKNKLTDVLLKIETAHKNRTPDSIIPQSGVVQLLVVSKSQPPELIREVYRLGQHSFGENYVQEAIRKQEILSDLDIEWHFIGPIQSNKTQQIAKHFDWVHGIDRLKIAQRLNDARPSSLLPLKVCIQINSSGEESKSGVSPADALDLALAIQALPHLHLKGLMTIPEPSQNLEIQKERYRMMRALLEKLNNQGLCLDTLSMGMSNDYEVAIMEGATIVRIGTSIFGARPSKTA
jgi:PLP dependent protein